MCMNFHTLPGPGGLLDQDYYLYHLLRAGMVALNEKMQQDQRSAMGRH